MSKLVVHSAAVLLTLCCAGCSGSKQSVAQYLERARQFEAAGNTEKAQLELEGALKVKPSDPEVNFELAKLQDAAGDLNSAMPHYLRAALPDAHILQAQLRVADVLLDSNRLQDASGRINATLGAFPDNPDALAMRADLLDRQGQRVQASTDANAAVQRDPGNARALAVRARLALRDKDGAGALKLIEQGLKQHPDDIRLLQVHAVALLTVNQPDKAVDALRSIVQASPRNVMAQSALAQLEARTGKVDDALAGLKAAVLANPNNHEMQLALVKFLAAYKSGADVAAYLNDMIARTRSSGIYDLALAGYYRGQGREDESKAVLDRAATRLGTRPDGLDVRVALAKLASDVGRGDEADAQLDAVLAKDPANVEALVYRAQLRLAGGRSAAAIQDLLTVLRQQPANVAAYQALAAAYLAQQEPQLAVEAMRRAASVVPGDTDIEIKLASFLENAKDATGAREVMSRLSLAQPQNPLVWIADAQIAIDRKDWGEATRAIDVLRGLPGGAARAGLLDAQVLAARGSNAAAAQRYASAILSDDSIDASLIWAYVRASGAAGQSAEAAALLAQRAPALKQDAQQQAWLSLIGLQAAVGQAAAAADAYAHLAQLAPKAADTYTTFANILTAHKEFDEARKVIAAGLAAGAPRVPLLMARAWVAFSAGDEAAALADYKAAMNADPMSIDAVNDYASIVTDRAVRDVGELTDLRKRLSGAESNPNPLVIDTIAWLDYRLKRYDEAKELLSRIKAGESQNPQLRFHMAAVLLASGDKAGGLALLNSVKGLTFPGSDEVQALSST